MYDWNDLRFLLAVGRSGTLAGAGAALGVDPTTVGRRIAALEQDLDVRLFDRTADGWVLTVAGRRVQSAAARAEAQLHDLDRKDMGDAGPSGLVRVASTVSMTSRFVLPALRPIQARHCALRVEIIAGRAHADLLRRQADVALRMGPRPRQHSLVARKVAAVGWGFYASREYAERRGVGRGLRTLRRHEIVGFGESIAALPMGRWLERQAGEATVSLRINNVSDLGAACAAGWGLTLLPHFQAREHPEIRPVGWRESPAPTEMWVVVPAELRAVPRVRAVADHLAEEALRRKRWFLDGMPD